jgi:hypothetical protein
MRLAEPTPQSLAGRLGRGLRINVFPCTLPPIAIWGAHAHGAGSTLRETSRWCGPTGVV